MESKFKKLINKTLELNNEMIDAIKDFLNENGKFIVTDFNKAKEIGADHIYGYIFSYEDDKTIEKPIFAISLEDNGNLAIYFGDYNEIIEKDDRNLEYIEKYYRDEKYYIDTWGEILINATLYNICESIEQYVQ